MVDRRRRSGNPSWDDFAQPPWSRDSEQWRKIDEQLEEDHLARSIDRAFGCLDLTDLLASYSGRGSKPLRPDLMLRIVLFEIQRGRTSPAQWYVDTSESIVLQWLGFGIRPSRSVWYEFAFRIGRNLDGWNQQILQQAQERKLVSGTRGALDGTTVEAHASRHHLLNQGQLEHRLELLKSALEADEKGVSLTEQPYWMAKHPETRCQQMERYEAAQNKLEERLAENRKRIPSQRQDEKNIRVSPTDPEAALGKDKHRVYRALYNVQYVRDLDSPFILGYDVFASSSDTGTFVPMMERTQQLVGYWPSVVTVDCSYVTALDLVDAQELGIEVYGPWRENDFSNPSKNGAAKSIGKDQFTWDEQAQEYRCPQGHSLRRRSSQNRKRRLGRTEKIILYEADAATCAACPLKARCCPKSKSGRHVNRSEHQEVIEAHRRKMETPEAKEIYKLRRQTVETSFGDSKQHRNFRRVNGRGLQRTKIQAGLTVLAHNLIHLAKAILAANPPPETI